MAEAEAMMEQRTRLEDGRPMLRNKYTDSMPVLNIHIMLREGSEGSALESARRDSSQQT